jgi:hypothetical protein
MCYYGEDGVGDDDDEDDSSGSVDDGIPRSTLQPLHA